MQVKALWVGPGGDVAVRRLEPCRSCIASPRIRGMSRHVRAFLLLIAMLWQTLAWVTPHGISLRANDLAHQAVHFLEQDHHHHADASLHMGEEVDSDKHLHPDSGAQSVGLFPSTERPVFALGPESLPRSTDLEPPSVVLDGLLRPPQVLS